MTAAFRRFIHELASVRLGPNAFNQYSHDRGPLEANAVRRKNLNVYLEELRQRDAGTLLIGEAPSYRGARLTGIAFVSESLLLCGVPEADMFGTGRGYRKTAEFEHVSTEASATVVWGVIRTIHPLPLLWNAFPFHPFRDGDRFTNRIPSRAELEIGRPFIGELMRMFSIRQVIAVGNQADLSLTLLGIDHAKVRHPSQGGKMKFVNGLRELLGDNPAPV